MPRKTVARINLDALRQNYRRASGLAGAARAMAVIKADGYGHGIHEVARALVDDAPKYAVACIEEAIAIREAGICQPVVLLQGPHSHEDVAVSAEQGFELVIHGDHQLHWLNGATATPPLWIKVNSGMNRLGFAPEAIKGVMARLDSSGLAEYLVGFVTHFARADDDREATEAQTECFSRATEAWPHLAKSIGNSAAHFRADQPLFDWSRPGIMLYGASPMADQTGPALGLDPAMTLEAELTSIRTLAPGDEVGYGATWKASEPTRMGVVAIGYGDGYPRHAGTGTPAWVNGQRIRLIGRVSMDMLAVDLSNAPEASPGDTVELWGQNVPVDEVAKHADTIGYELLTGVTARVPRIYENSRHRPQ